MATPRAAAPTSSFSTGENFAALLEESFQTQAPTEGSVLEGTVIALDNDAAVIDVGLKSAGRVSLREFAQIGRAHV